MDKKMEHEMKAREEDWGFQEVQFPFLDSLQ